MKTIIILVLCAFTFVGSTSNCSSFDTCRECIQAVGCAWNLDQEYDTWNSRCFAYNREINNNVYYAESKIFITENKPINETVLLSPQKASLQLGLQRPVFLKILLKDNDSLAPPHLQNIIVEFTRNESNSITAKVEAISCPKSTPQFHQIIELLSYQTRQKLTLDVDILCHCPCEDPTKSVLKAPQCQYHGTYQCGVCKCEHGFYGKSCECLGEKEPSNCRENNDCSGRGQCVCGTCNCHVREHPAEKIFGQNCECDNYSCERYQGQICAGSEHGSCECGKCHCRNEWSGSDCSQNN